MSKGSEQNINPQTNNNTVEKNSRELIAGFSKFNREERIRLLQNWLGEDLALELNSFLHSNPEFQTIFSEFSENYLTNYYLPFGVVPNVLINNEFHLVPFVMEESSVVAAASRAAGFWAKHGGFKTEILGTTKKGQVHFMWSGTSELLNASFSELKEKLITETDSITKGMRNRGGGISNIELLDLSSKIDNYYQLDVSFDTADAMGANFINSCLEKMAHVIEVYFSNFEDDGTLEVIMSILSNHTPESVVKCSVQCEVKDLKAMSGQYSAEDFARRFSLAVKMAQHDVSRAVTHNKGIYNGVDGVVLATGNDWRAIEAAGHAFAASSGEYRALSEVDINEDGKFTYYLKLPLAIGTVGGVTKSHPMAKVALKMLKNPSANHLMEIIASLGMANNFSAVASLVTSGIQKGHMKMHLSNMLNQIKATDEQKEKAFEYFKNREVSYSALNKLLNN
jgi:hydroxymethylglutaryl-CoA reductase